MGKPTPNPDDRWIELLQDMERRLRALERGNPRTLTFEDVRTDLPSGRGPRVRVGLLSDGVSWGIERWTSAGVRQLPTWS